MNTKRITHIPRATIDRPVGALVEIEVGAVHGHDHVVGAGEGVVTVEEVRVRQLATLELLAKRAGGPRQGVARTGREGDVVVREAAVRVARGYAEEAVVALAVHVEAPRVLDGNAGVPLLKVDAVDGGNLPAPLRGLVAALVRQGELALHVLERAIVVDGELDGEVRVPIDGVDGRPHGLVHLVLADVVDERQVVDHAAREVPEGHRQPHFARHVPAHTTAPFCLSLVLGLDVGLKAPVQVDKGRAVDSVAQSLKSRSESLWTWSDHENKLNGLRFFP